ERGSTDRVENGEAALRAGDPGQLSQPGYRIQQVRDQAGRENRVKASVADRQALGVAEYEATDTLPTKTLRFEQHLGRRVDPDNSPLRAHHLPHEQQGSTGPTPDIEHAHPAPYAQLT